MNSEVPKLSQKQSEEVDIGDRASAATDSDSVATTRTAFAAAAAAATAAVVVVNKPRSKNSLRAAAATIENKLTSTDRTNKLYVRFPKKLEETAIRDLHPLIDRIQIPRQKSARWCLLSFETRKDCRTVIRALKKTKIDNKSIKVKRSSIHL